MGSQMVVADYHEVRDELSIEGQSDVTLTVLLGKLYDYCIRVVHIK